MLTIDPLTPAVGAEISGVDLGRPVADATAEAIHAALLDRLVIFFRDQDISPQAHLDFAAAFGELDAPHPLYPHVAGHERIVRLETGAGSPPDTNSWHTDLTFKAEPPFAAVLVARDVPPTGGDTLWTSLHAAWDALPAGMKADLEGLEAVHDMGDFRNSFADAADPGRLTAAMGRFGLEIRPIAGTHPVTGRRFLNFNDAFVTHIVGLTSRDSDSLKDWLCTHMNRPEFQVRFRWRPGSVAMWDNRVTMHYAVADYLPAHRCMHRVTVVRDRRAQAAPMAAGA